MRKPWMTRDLYGRIRHKNEKCHVFIWPRDPRLFIEFKKCRNKLSADLIKSERRILSKRTSTYTHSHRKVWDTVNKLTNRDQARGNLKEMLIDNKRVTGKELGDEMNRHFISMGAHTGRTSSIDDCIDSGNQIGSIMLTSTTPS